jgi:CRISPR type I-E-associated protein CasB/Cse2
VSDVETMGSDPTADQEPASPAHSLGKTINRIAAALQREVPPGDVAALRRLVPDDPSSPAFWRMVVNYLGPTGAIPDGGPARDEVERQWAAILGGMAVMQGLHQPGRRLGKALAASDLSELRFVRLLRAQDRQLLREVRTTARFLASKAEAVDWSDLARLVLTRDPDKAERVRRSFARDYYSAQKS